MPSPRDLISLREVFSFVKVISLSQFIVFCNVDFSCLDKFTCVVTCKSLFVRLGAPLTDSRTGHGFCSSGRKGVFPSPSSFSVA